MLLASTGADGGPTRSVDQSDLRKNVALTLPGDSTRRMMQAKRIGASF